MTHAVIQETDRRMSPRALARWALSAAVAVLLPLTLMLLPETVARSTYGRAYRIFEFFGFSGALFILYNVWVELRRHTGRGGLAMMSWQSWAKVLLPTLFAFQVLLIFSEYAFMSWDYRCYDAAARALRQGQNPYGACYLYPPLLAQVMALAYDAIAQMAALTGVAASSDHLTLLVFYGYQCLQFFAVLTAYALCYRMARDLGLGQLASLICVTGLFAANNPLLRNIRHNQVNVLLLDLMLLSILGMLRAPFLSGLPAAVGGLLKLYPFVLGLPWVVAKKWRAVAGAAVGVVVIVALQTGFGSDLTLWRQFLLYFQDPKRGSSLRDNSLHSLAINTARVLGAGDPGWIGIPVAALAVCVLAFFAWRAWRRVQAYRFAQSLDAEEGAAERRYLYGFSVDMLGLMLLLSPMVWEHHYVFALPLSVWSLATRWRLYPWRLIAANALIYLLPTFDLYPFSYHRLVGLALLLWWTHPYKAPDSGA